MIDADPKLGLSGLTVYLVYLGRVNLFHVCRAGKYGRHWTQDWDNEI